MAGAQKVADIEVQTPTDQFTLHGRPCNLSAFSFIPTDRKLPPERTYFNVDKKDRYSYSVYNRLFMRDYGFEPHIRRDDRAHANARELYINDEEQKRVVPVQSSSIYGHRLTVLDPLAVRRGRTQIIQTEFYRTNGVNVKPDNDHNIAIKK